MRRFRFFLASCALFLIANASMAQGLDNAKKLFYEEQYAKVIASLKQLSKSDPSNAEINYLLGKTYFEDNDADSALWFFTEAARLSPESPYTHLAAGRVAIAKKDKESAKAAFDKAISLNKKNSDIIVEAGEAAVKQDSSMVDYTKELFTKHEKVCKKNINFYLVRGDIDQMQGSGGTAIANYNQAKEIDKKDPRAYMRTANVWQSARRYDLALQNLEEAEKLNPNFPPLLRELGEVKFLKGDFISAKDYYGRYLNIIGNDLNAKIKYVKFLYLSKLYDKAIEGINEILAVDKSATVLYRLLGYCYYELQKYPEGVKAMEYFMSQQPASKIMQTDYTYYGRLLARNKQDSAAYVVLLKAYQMDSTDISIWNELLQTSYNLKQYKNAIYWQNKRINAFKSFNQNEYMKVGQIYYAAGDYLGADSVYKMILQKTDSNNIALITWRARCYTQLDNQDKPKGLAKPFYQKVIDLGMNDVAANKKELIEANRYMGFLFFKAKKYNKALEYFKAIKQIDPAYPGNDEIIKQIEGILKKQSQAKQKQKQESDEDAELQYLNE